MINLRIFWVAVWVLVSHTCFGQKIKLSFSAGANLPFINKVIQPRVYLPVVTGGSSGYVSSLINVGQVDQEFTTSPGFQGGFSAYYGLNEKFAITAGLSATHFRYQQKLIVSANSSLTSGLTLGGQNSNITTVGFPSIVASVYTNPSDQGQTQVTYLTLPVTVDYTFAKNWTASAGLNAHVIMAANVRRYTYSSTTMGGMLVSVDDRSADGFTNVLVGAGSQVRYQVMKPWSIDLGYSFIFTPVYDQPSNVPTPERPARYGVLSLSARYWLK